VARLCALSVVLLSLSGHAHGQEERPRERAARLHQEGKELGNQGDFTAATSRFIRAYLASPDIAYLCNIGYALSAAKIPERAFSFLALCETRASGDVAVDAAKLRAEMGDELRAAGFATVTISTSPEGAHVSVAGYLEGLRISAPVIVALRPGTYTLSAEASELKPHQQTFTVERSEPTALLVELKPEPERSGPSAEQVRSPPASRPAVQSAVPAPAETRPLSPAWKWVTLGASVVSVGVGAAFLARANRDRDQLETALPPDDWRSTSKSMRRNEIGAWVGLGVGAGLALASAYLFLGDESTEASTLSAGASADGAALSLGGSF